MYGTQSQLSQSDLLFDFSEALGCEDRFDRAFLEAKLPHRERMLLLDAVVWMSPGCDRGVGRRRVREDEFWADGHFPGDPVMPGVLMVEMGAQLACCLHNCRVPSPQKPALVKIDRTSFRAAARPGDELYILCREVRWTPRRFVTDIQGVVNGRVAFESRIAGVAAAARARAASA